MKKLFAALMMVIMAVTLVSCGKSSKNEYTFKEINDDVKIKETVIVDDERIKITAKDIEFKDSYVEIVLEFEDLTDIDSELYFKRYSDDMGLAVNGYMIDSSFSCSIDGLEKKEESIYIPYSNLYMRGISDIAFIDLSLFYDNPLYSEERFEATIKTSVYDKYKQPDNSYQNAMADEKALEAVGIKALEIKTSEHKNNEGVFVKSVAFANIDDETHIYVEVFNNNEKAVIFESESFKIDNIVLFDESPVSGEIFPKSTLIVDIAFNDLYSQELEMLGIDVENPGSVEFEALIYIEDGEDVSLGTASCVFDENKSFDSNGEVIYDSNQIKIISKGITCNNQYTVPIFVVENNSDFVINFDDGFETVATVNGQIPSYQGLISPAIKPGESAVLSMFFMNNHLEGLGITDKSQITEFTLKTSIVEYQNRRNIIDEIELKVNY